jgi:hypothetical protein
MDGVEKIAAIRLCPLEDSTSLLDDPAALRVRADRDGFLFFRALIAAGDVLPLRDSVLDYAGRNGWLETTAHASDSLALPAKRIGCYTDSDWIGLQAHVRNGSAIWDLGNTASISRALRAADPLGRWTLSTAVICRVCSPHPDMATPPHTDAQYVHSMGDFWTAWIPLQDSPQELGPIALAAGSHLHAAPQHRTPAVDEIEWSTADFGVGDVVLFRARTLHRALPNRSGDRLRLSVDLRYGVWNETMEIDWRAATLSAALGA